MQSPDMFRPWSVTKSPPLPYNIKKKQQSKIEKVTGRRSNLQNKSISPRPPSPISNKLHRHTKYNNNNKNIVMSSGLKITATTTRNNSNNLVDNNSKIEKNNVNVTTTTTTTSNNNKNSGGKLFKAKITTIEDIERFDDDTMDKVKVQFEAVQGKKSNINQNSRINWLFDFL